jgi:YbbR domain-containing protein
VQLSPSQVAVKISIEQRLGFKEVSVKAVTSGQVAPGYWISNITAEPSTVTLQGNPEDIEQIPGFIETVPIDVDSAIASLNRVVRLALPPGSAVLSGETVRVIIEITPILGGQTIQRPVQVQGLGRGLRMEVSPQQVDVILSGPLQELQELKPFDVQVVVDVTNLGVGTHKLTPSVTAPSSLRAENIAPSTVEVVIIAIPTPTPAPTRTPTPTLTPTPTAAPTLTPTLTPSS